MYRRLFKSVLFVYFLLSYSISHGQSEKIDSLLRSMDKEINNELKVDKLNDLAYEFLKVDVIKSETYASQALELAKRIQYESGRGEALVQLGLAAMFKGNYDDALKLTTEGFEIAEREGNQERLMKACNGLAFVYNYSARNDKSLEYTLQALTAAEKLRDSASIIVYLQNIGYLHTEENNIAEANKYYSRLSTFSIDDKKPRVQLAYYNGVGILNKNLGRYKKAIQTFNKGIPIATEANDLYGVAVLHEGLGLTYKDAKSFPEAKLHYIEAMNFYEKIGSNDQYLYIVKELINLYNLQGDYPAAVTLGEEGLELAKNISIKEHLSGISYELATAYEQLGQYDISLQHHKEHKRWSDSLTSSAKEKIILEMESDYQLSLLEEQQKKNESIIAQQKFRNIAFFLLFLMACLATLFWWINYKNKEKYSKSLEVEVEARTNDLKQSNQDLAYANNELERFAFISAHDIKEHLRNIASFSGLIQKETQSIDLDSSKLDSYYGVLNKSTSSMDQLVNDIMEFTSINKNTTIGKVNLNSTVSEIKRRLSTNGQEEILDFETLPTIEANAKLMGQLFSQLIDNGVKFNHSDHPKVKIEYKQTSDNHLFNIKDNGIGIDETYADEAFKMFSRLQDRSVYQGSGIGLAIAKKIITQLNGKIGIQNNEGPGTTVSLVIPIKSVA